MSSSRGRRRASESSRDVVRRRFVDPRIELRPYRESARVQAELRAFKERERMNRRIVQDRERLTRDALQMIEDERDALATRGHYDDILPPAGTRAYKNYLKKEEADGKISMSQILMRRSGTSTTDVRQKKQRYLRYDSKVKEFIEEVAFSRLRNLLSKGHIEALQNDATSFGEFRKLAMDVLIATLEDADEEYERECTFCDKYFASNRLRMKHTHAEHFPFFATKAIDAIQSFDPTE